MTKKTNLPAKLGETFVLANPNDPAYEISDELAAEISEEDFDGYSESSKTIPIVEIRNSELLGENNEVIYPMGGIGIYDPVSSGKIPPEDLDEITFSVLGTQPARVFFPQLGQKPTCQSSDAIIGVGTPGGKCNSCQLNRFADKLDKKRKLPEKLCKEQRHLLCRDTSGLCYMLRIGPSGISVTDNLIEQIQRQSRAARRPIPTAMILATMSTLLMTDKGKYYVPVFQVVGNLSDLDNSVEIWREIKKLREQSKAYFTNSAEAVENGSTPTASELPPDVDRVPLGDEPPF